MFWRNKKQASTPPVTTSGFSLGVEPQAGANLDTVLVTKLEDSQLPLERDVQRRSVPGTYVIPVGYKVSGPIFTTRPVRIDGELTGRGLVAREVFVSPTGVLRQSAEVESLIIEGRVMAPVKARGSVELRAGGELRGEVDSPVLRVNAGGILSDCLVAVGERRV